MQLEVETLQRWLEEHKSHVVESLTEALSTVERLGTLWPAPSVRGGDSLSRRSSPAPSVSAAPAQSSAAAVQAASEPPARPPAATDTVAWPAVDAESTQLLPVQPDDTDPGSSDAGDSYDDDRAMDDFFDDNDRYNDDHRIGGRLRRRR